MTQAEIKASEEYPKMQYDYAGWNERSGVGRRGFAAGHKEGAIAFAEWTQIYDWLYEGHHKWWNSATDKRAITAELYEQFNQGAHV